MKHPTTVAKYPFDYCVDASHVVAYICGDYLFCHFAAELNFGETQRPPIINGSPGPNMARNWPTESNGRAADAMSSYLSSFSVGPPLHQPLFH